MPILPPIPHRARKALFFTSALAVLGTPALAQDEGFFQMLGRLILGTGAAKVAIDTPQAVTALAQEDLDRQQPATIGDVLKAVPGAQSAGASARPLGQAINIRGIGNSEQTASEERIKVVVDGAPKFFEQYRLGSFFADPELFKRVEILRGPASSTLYGSGTIGGVVAFTTKDASDFLQADETTALRFRLGHETNGNAVKPGVVYAQRAGQAEFLLALNASKGGKKKDGAGAVIAGTDHRSASGLLKGRLSFGNDHDQSLTLSLSRTDTDLDGAPVAQTGGAAVIPAFGLADIRSVDDTVSLTWRHAMAGNDLLDLTVQLSHTNTDVTKGNFTGSALTCAPGNLQVLCDSDFGYPTTSFKIENAADLSAGDWQNILTFGLQFTRQRREATSVIGPLSFHPEGSDRKLGLYAQGEFVWDDRLTLIPGLRVDFADRTPSAFTQGLGGLPVKDSAISPKLSALYRVNDSWALFGTLARTERMPTLDELYSTDAGRLVSLNLDKERAHSVELGLTFQRAGLLSAGDSLQMKATAFHSDIANLIVVNAAAGPVPRFDNVRAAEIWGAEVEASYDADRWFARLGYSNVRSAFRETGRPGNEGAGLTLPDTPAENLALTLGLKLPDQGLILGWTATHVAPITNSTVPTSVMPVSAVTTPGYDVHDLFVTWSPRSGALEGVQVALAVENLFDADYKNNLALDRAPGLNAKLSVTKGFTW